LYIGNAIPIGLTGSDANEMRMARISEFTAAVDAARRGQAWET
jgi:hypothetical protein